MVTERSKRVLDIGCGKHKIYPHAVGLDRAPLAGVDVVHDLNCFPYPFPDASFDEVHARMVLEHLRDLVASMQEIHRILVPGGMLVATVPYYATRSAFQDPTHRNFFTEGTFAYFTAECELSYYGTARFEIVTQQLVANGNSFQERVRKFIPFRRLLRQLLWNMYDEIHVVMKKA